MKRLILLIITCYGLLSGYANTDTASDSLLQVLQTLPHDTTRLSTLNDIIKIEQNNYKCIQYSDSLMQEACSQMDSQDGTVGTKIRFMGLFLRRPTLSD